MDSTQYLEALVAEKNSLDPSYHPNAVRLIAEGKRALYLSIFNANFYIVSAKHALCDMYCVNICFVFAVN